MADDPKRTPRSIDDSVKAVIDQLAKYVEDVATMTVITKYQVIADNTDIDFKTARAAAKSEIYFDGDSITVVPVRQVNGEVSIHEALDKVHQENVQAAIKYRSDIVTALKDVLQEVVLKKA